MVEYTRHASAMDVPVGNVRWKPVREAFLTVVFSVLFFASFPPLFVASAMGVKELFILLGLEAG